MLCQAIYMGNIASRRQNPSLWCRYQQEGISQTVKHILPELDASVSVWYKKEEGASLPVLPLCSRFRGHAGD